MTQSDLFRTFFALHERGLLLPNAWDAASARVFEHAGFPAVGTTSAGVAYTLGRRDGQRLSRAEMLGRVTEIVRAVRVPVNADIEAGYGDAPDEVAHTARAFVEAGAVGLNLEDATGRPERPLYGVSEQARRIGAARHAADRVGGPTYLNARTDTYLLAVGADPEARFEETVYRGRAYLAAGADSVFVPLLTDPALLEALRREMGGPVSVMAVPGGPSAPALLAAGASRVSFGQGLMLAALGLTAQVARELRQTGTSPSWQAHFYGFQEAEALF